MAKAAGAMEESVSSIFEVMNVIRAFSSRTNLLTMNAAIEAVHAARQV